MEKWRPLAKRARAGFIALQLLAVTSRLRAGDFLPTLKIGSEIYSNVTVTSFTATDIYFQHAQGLGNAKLKNLALEDQKHFRFDATKSHAVELQQTAASQRYHQEIAARKPAPKPVAPTDEDDSVPPVTDDNGDPVVTKIHAQTFRGQRPPPIIVDQWLTPAPVATGKFVLVDFWATWCGPCRLAIPHLNALQAKFKDRLVVIGLSNETPEDMRKAALPPVNYYVGTDPQARTRAAVQVKGIPHAILMDPGGVVRFEGQPIYLEAAALERLMAKYPN